MLSLNEKNNFAIDYLANHQEWIHTIAEWTCNAWKEYDPTLSIEKSKESIKTRLNTTKIPLTLVVSTNNLPVATANLKNSVPVQGVPEGKVWLGSFYVKNEYRKQGIGSMLMEAILSKAIELGKKEVFLFSSDHTVTSWYEKHKWKIVNELPFQNHKVIIMRWEAP